MNLHFFFGSIYFYNNCDCQFLTNHRIKNEDIMVKSATQFQNKKKKECIGKIYRKETKKKGDVAIYCLLIVIWLDIAIDVQ